MMTRTEVDNAFHIHRPSDRLRILWPRDEKFRRRQCSSASAEQFFQLRLTVGSVGPHIAQVTFEFRADRKFSMAIRINRTVEWNCAGYSKVCLQFLQQRSAGETEVNIQVRQLPS